MVKNRKNYLCISSSLIQFPLQFYKCLCKPGYTGSKCENEINECEGDPCHSGKCTDLINDFKCDCNGTGFTGDTCHEDIDECLISDPCLHGQCNNLAGSYNCDCEDGYCGTNCQRKDPCQLVGLQDGIL